MKKLRQTIYFLSFLVVLVLFSTWLFISQNSIGKITQAEIEEFAGTDSLKLAAANYLLENSVDKYTRISIKKISVKIPDKNFVSKKWFFNNIEMAVLQAEARIKKQEFTTQQFFEYVLPYRLRFEIPENWRSNPIENLDTCFDENIFVHASKINNAIRPNFTFKVASKDNRRFSNIFKNRDGTCNEMSDFAAFNMRANGIPVAVDFTKWENIVGGHQWNSLVLKDKNEVFMGMETNPTDSNHIGMITGVYKKPAKIYRKTFQKSEFWEQDFDPKKLINESNFKDVTKEYYPNCLHIFIDLPDASKNDSYFFLCVYQVNNWVPVAYSKAKRGLLVFQDVIPNSVFALKVWENNQLLPYKNPFTFDSLGVVTFRENNPGNRRDVKLAFFNSKERELIRSFNEAGYDETMLKYNDILLYNKTAQVKNSKPYQLFYWDKKWVFAGENTAANDSVLFQNVPENALYKMEIPDSATSKRFRCFTVDNNNVQHWW